MKCRYPIQINVRGRQIYVPCGKCAWCLQRLRKEWVLRLKMEAKAHDFNYFLTFTYRDEDLPLKVNVDTGELVNTVNLDHIQSFHKSLRNKGYKFRYLLTSEYGSRTLRPHYHGIYFTDSPVDFAKFWPFGDNNVQLPASEAAFKYVLKYMLKGSKVPEGADPNFRVVSRRPGIGSCFEYKGTPYIVTDGGIKCAVPRFYSRNYENKLSSILRDHISVSESLRRRGSRS